MRVYEGKEYGWELRLTESYRDLGSRFRPYRASQMNNNLAGFFNKCRLRGGYCYPHLNTHFRGRQEG